MSEANAALAQAPEPVSPQTDKPKMKMNRLKYDGKAGKIFGIWIMTFFMKIITLGIYTFWGKTRMRKYIASSFSLGGDRFEYTGTGKELFLGFLKAIPVLLLIYAPFFIVQAVAPGSGLIILCFIPLFYVVPMAIFMALRYRMSRLTWRGIRGALTGSAIKYANLSLKRSFINVFSLGLFIPYSDMIKHKFIVEHAYFGNVKGEFKTSAKKLMKTHIITLLLAVPTLGISRFWYRAALQRAKANGMIMGDLRFKCNTTGWDLYKNLLGNVMVLLLTVGLGVPVVINRNMKFFARHNAIGGDLDTSAIMQAKDQKIVVGEALDDAMGLDGGFL